MFYLTFRRTPGEGSPHFDRFDGQNFTFPALWEGTRVSTSAEVDQGSAFGNRKPLKRLDLNFIMGLATSSRADAKASALFYLRCKKITKLQ